MSFRLASYIVFFSSFCLMTIEIVAGRMIAPYLGSSVYSWTSVIGVVLTGIALGNYAGGQLADKQASRAFVGRTMLLSAVMSALAPLLARVFGTWIAAGPFPLPLATLLFAIFSFFPVSFFLSFVSPMVVKLALVSLAETGSVVGRIYAASAAGSILGTFVAGFFFVASFGSSTILWIIAVALFAVGLTLWMPTKAIFRKGSVIGAGFLALAVVFPQTCAVETQYYCISEAPIERDGNTGMSLRLDRLVHGFIFPDALATLEYDYEQLSAQVLAHALSGDEPKRILFLGGGSYTLPRYLDHFYPEHRVTVVELDPGVTKFNREHFGLAQDTAMTIVHDDARRFLARLPEGEQFDVIVGDAFNDFSVPFHLTTQEFLDILKEHLVPDGTYLLNVIDDAQVGRFLASKLATLSDTFAYVALATQKEDWETVRRNTFLIVASDAPIDHDAIVASVPRGREGMEQKNWTGFLYTKEFASFVQQKNGIVLTDAFAPVDIFLAPVFRRL